MKKEPKKRLLDDATFANMSLFIGIGIIVILIFFKTLRVPLPILGEELHIFFGISWDIYIKRNIPWFIAGILLIVIGIVQLISNSNRRKQIEKNKAAKKKA